MTMEKLEQRFSDFGPIVSIEMPLDKMTNANKGYSFLQFCIPEAAGLARDQMNGIQFKGMKLTV